MKIMLVEPFARHPGHPSVNAKFMSQGFTDAGLDVTLITFDGVLGDWLAKDTRIKHLSVLSESGIFTPLVRFLSRLLRWVIFLRLFNLAFDTFVTFRLAFRQNRRQRYDVIHIVDASMPPFSLLAFASRTKDCNLVHTLYGIPEGSDFLQNWGRKFRISLKKRDYSLCNRLLLARLENSRLATVIQRSLYHRAIRRNRLAFACFSKAEQQAYSGSMFYDRIVILPLARPKLPSVTQQEARQYLGLPEVGKLLLSFGVNHDMKNYEVIFQAVQGLPQDFKLLFAGKIVSQQNDPKRFAQEYDWGGNTIILDKYIPEEEVPYYFYAADALLLSYRKEFLQHSGNMLYACQYGLPVIASASDGGQLGEDVKGYYLGLTFTPEDPQSFREAILSFLRLGEAEKQVIKEGLQRFASTYSWEQMVKNHLELYKHLSEEAG